MKNKIKIKNLSFICQKAIKRLCQKDTTSKREKISTTAEIMPAIIAHKINVGKTSAALEGEVDLCKKQQKQR